MPDDYELPKFFTSIFVFKAFNEYTCDLFVVNTNSNCFSVIAQLNDFGISLKLSKWKSAL